MKKQFTNQTTFQTFLAFANIAFLTLCLNSCQSEKHSETLVNDSKNSIQINSQTLTSNNNFNETKDLREGITCVHQEWINK